MKYLKLLYIKLKLLYYTGLDYLDDGIKMGSLTDTVIERQKANVKLAKGVRRLVQRLRSMSPSERISTENLLCKDRYRKTRKEKLDELKVIDKVYKNPILRTEDDLVYKVVKKAPIYHKEQEIAETRRAITASLRLANEDPTNPLHQQTVLALRGKLKRLRGDIERLRENERS